MTSTLESVVRAVTTPAAKPPAAAPVASRVSAVDLYLDSPAPSAPDIELPIGEPASLAASAGARPSAVGPMAAGIPGASLGTRKFGPLAIGTGVGLLLAVLLVAVLQLRQALTPAAESAATQRAPRPPVVDAPQARVPPAGVDAPLEPRAAPGNDPARVPTPPAMRAAPAGPPGARAPSTQAPPSPTPVPATEPGTTPGQAARRSPAGNGPAARDAADAEADAALEAAERLLGAGQTPARGAPPAAPSRRAPTRPAPAGSRTP